MPLFPCCPDYTAKHWAATYCTLGLMYCTDPHIMPWLERVMQAHACMQLIISVAPTTPSTQYIHKHLHNAYTNTPQLHSLCTLGVYR